MSSRNAGATEVVIAISYQIGLDDKSIIQALKDTRTARL